MTSKEAVYAVLNHETPDHIPLGVYTIDCDTAGTILGRETYVRDKIRSQIAIWEGRRDEVAESLREDAVELYRKLDCIDILLPSKDAPILPPFDYEPPKVRRVDEKRWETEDGTIYQCSFETNDMSVVYRPPREYTVEDFAWSDSPPLPDPSIFEAYDHYVQAFRGTRFIAGTAGGFSPMALDGGMEAALIRYALEPEVAAAATAHHTAVHNARDKLYIRDGVDEVFVEQDFASSQGPLISPQMFAETVFPAMRERIRHIKTLRRKVIFHCCGNVWKLLPMFVEAGVDCYQSLQTGVMDLGELKRAHGKDLAFWGGVAVEHLVMGTMDEVRADVRSAFEATAGAGGFILGPSHSIAYGTKYDNFMAMLDEYDRLKTWVR